MERKKRKGKERNAGKERVKRKHKLKLVGIRKLAKFCPELVNRKSVLGPSATTSCSRKGIVPRPTQL